MEKFLAPFSMLNGSGSTKAYLVIGALVALALAASRKSKQSTSS
ncbi:hypothetical protein [Undibacterium sp. Di24W]